MKTLFLLRHGEADTTQQQYPHHSTMGLSKRGMVQARAMGVELARFSIEALYCSPFRRAEQTAEIVGAQIDCVPVVYHCLKERVFKNLYGQRYDTIAAQYGQRFVASLMNGEADKINLADSEPIDVCIQRVVTGMQAILNRTNATRLVIVFHGGPHDWFLQSCLGMLQGRKFARVFSLALGHVTVITVDHVSGQICRVKGINLSPIALANFELSAMVEK